MNEAIIPCFFFPVQKYDFVCEEGHVTDLHMLGNILGMKAGTIINTGAKEFFVSPFKGKTLDRNRSLAPEGSLWAGLW